MVTAISPTSVESRVSDAFLALLESLPSDKLNRFLKILFEPHIVEFIQFNKSAAFSENSISRASIRSNTQIVPVISACFEGIDFSKIKKELQSRGLKKRDEVLLLIISPEHVPVFSFDFNLNCKVTSLSFAMLERKIDEWLYESGEKVTETDAIFVRQIKTLIYSENLVRPHCFVEFNEVAIVTGNVGGNVAGNVAEGMLYGMLVCNSTRPFRRVKNVGFYLHNAIYPNIPRIIDIYENIEIRSGLYSGRLGDLVNHAIQVDSRRVGGRFSIVSLSSSQSPETLKLPKYISDDYLENRLRNEFTTSYRYVTFEALQNANTTSDLV